MYATNALFKLNDVFSDRNSVDALFLKSIKETLNFHYNNSPFYKKICYQNLFSPADVKTFQDIKKIPYIFVDVFKQYKLLSVPEKDIVFTLASSGTKGVKSRIMWDKTSLDRQTIMREKTMKSLGLVSAKPVNYMIFSYDYAQSKGRGAAYAHEMYAKFAPAEEKYYALRIRKKDEDFSFDINEAKLKLKKFVKTSLPLRILGFPSFTYFTVKVLMKKYKKLEIHPESLIINGGGWKTHLGKEIPKALYRRQLAGFFNISEDRIIDIFGMVEHGVPYISCPHGNFHEPLYSKIFIRHPLNGNVLPDGQVGLLQFLTPYIRSMPSLSLLSSDLGYISRKTCPCGIKKPYFIILRRGGTTLYKGCSLTALTAL